MAESIYRIRIRMMQAVIGLGQGNLRNLGQTQQGSE